MSHMNQSLDFPTPRRGEPDYLRYPDHPTYASFHSRTGKPFFLPEGATRSGPANEFGYPLPGVQSPTPAHATAAHYFVDDATWGAIIDHGDFDDIVCGSGFCALAYVTEALKLNPHRKILILERGGFWLPEYFQNLPLPFKMVLGGPSETFPWHLTSVTYRSDLKFMHGPCPFFGGRSTFWSAWCPQPSPKLMRGFPQSMIDTAASDGFWESAKDLLHITPANKINDLVFGDLQKDVDKRLEDGLKRILTAMYAESVSTPGPLLALQEKQRQLAKVGQGSPLMIAIDVVAQSFLVDSENYNVVNVLKTSRGDLCFPDGKTNDILATGAIPATTILFNSLKSMQERAGKRVTGHFLTHITARFPIERQRFPHFRKCSKGKDCKGTCGQRLQIAASYLAGEDPKSPLQYHVQVTAIHSPHPEWDAVDAGRECPDYAAAATYDQLRDSEDYVVLVCATLGKLNEHNPNSWIKRNVQDPNVTTNITLQVSLAETDRNLWSVMDAATYDAIKVIAGTKQDEIEYCHDDKNSSEWRKKKPDTSEIHVPGIVHEASTLYMGVKDDPNAGVDENYTPYGCQNVYVTGAAIFPSAGSWNPTLTIMCGYAQDLARKVHANSKESKTA